MALDPTGEILPAIAERWIVTDDGQSYIFRLRDSDWPDEQLITASDVADLLRESLQRLEGTSLGLDLAKVTDVRAMTGRVIEIKLSSPMPEFLRLMAQPELGFVSGGGGTGPMSASREEGASVLELSAVAPEDRGLPARRDWEELSKPLTVQAIPASHAVSAFSSGAVDLLINGQISSFPSAQLGPLSRGNIRVDPALGLFGFVIRNDDGVLATAELREALSMALDRASLIEPFGLTGWASSRSIVPDELLQSEQILQVSWAEMSLDERRSIAFNRIRAWEEESGEDAVLRVALPGGAGSDLLLNGIAQNWEAVGVRVVRVAQGEGAELQLRDRLARYSSPRWFLNQFNCELELGLCSEDADALVAQSLVSQDLSEKAQLLAQAHSEMLAQQIFIPIGAPVRWSLVRGTIEAFEPNQWGIHPLFPLSSPTI
ncbi:MAG: ABC transporter substrate-binding protein [Erythrobacter sp.]